MHDRVPNKDSISSERAPAYCGVSASGIILSGGTRGHIPGAARMADVRAEFVGRERYRETPASASVDTAQGILVFVSKQARQARRQWFGNRITSMKKILRRLTNISAVAAMVVMGVVPLAGQEYRAAQPWRCARPQWNLAGAERSQL
jgi:hypothetical protein